MKKVVFCIPTMTRPFQECLDSLAASIAFLDDYDHYLVSEIGCPYISGARAAMLRKALDHKADEIVFIDHDLSWQPKDLETLLNVKADVVGGIYRFKEEKVRYMGVLDTYKDGAPKRRKDGCLKATMLPAGFLKVTKEAVDRFMTSYPELCYGEKYSLSVDLFNHGAHEGKWWGEDYAFCRRWNDMSEELWLCPDLTLTHHMEGKKFTGNFHQFLISQKGK